MSNNGTESKKQFDVRTLGIEETDSCPCCKRQLKGMVEEYEGGCLKGQAGEWICLNCGALFIPKSVLRKTIDRAKKASESRIIKPSLVVPPGVVGKS